MATFGISLLSLINSFNIKQVNIVKHNSECESSRHLYQIRVKERDKLMEFLNKNEIFPGVHYKNNTEYEIYKHGRDTCPNAHRISNEIITLPIFPLMTENDIEDVILS